MPGVPVDVVDVTGAGDTYCSSFVSMMEACGDPAMAGTFATYAASLATRRWVHAAAPVGTQPVLELCAGAQSPGPQRLQRHCRRTDKAGHGGPRYRMEEMKMKLKAVDARSIDFAPYGKLFNLRAEGEGLCYSCAADYTGSCTAAP